MNFKNCQQTTALIMLAEKLDKQTELKRHIKNNEISLKANPDIKSKEIMENDNIEFKKELREVEDHITQIWDRIKHIIAYKDKFTI